MYATHCTEQTVRFDSIPGGHLTRELGKGYFESFLAPRPIPSLSKERLETRRHPSFRQDKAKRICKRVKSHYTDIFTDQKMEDVKSSVF
jgi:hypothetical protein